MFSAIKKLRCSGLPCRPIIRHRQWCLFAWNQPKSHSHPFTWHCKGDVLPLSIRQQGFLLDNPLISEFLAAGVTQPGFTAKTDCFDVNALVIAACEAGIAHDNPPAGQHLADGINHSLTDGINVAQG